VISGALAVAVSVYLSGCNSRSVPKTDIKATGEAHAQPKSNPERMPEFSLKDTAGREVSSAQFHGKVVLLDFWATWCAPCKREMPGYEGLYRRYKDRGLEVVGIAADSDVGLVSRFGRKLGITYPLLVNGMDVQRYGVEGLPTTILVDSSGIIRQKVVGFEYTSAIEGDLKEILKGQ